jgi:transcriptional regulator with XRE-family HTH domain
VSAARIVRPEPSEIGARIRARRLELGLTQAALSARADLNRNHVYQVERAYYNTAPSAYTLGALSQALGVSLDYLWFGGQR